MFQEIEKAIIGIPDWDEDPESAEMVSKRPAALTRSKSEGSRMLELLRSEVEELEEVKGQILDKEDGTRKRRMVRPDTL